MFLLPNYYYLVVSVSTWRGCGCCRALKSGQDSLESLTLNNSLLSDPQTPTTDLSVSNNNSSLADSPFASSRTADGVDRKPTPAPVWSMNAEVKQMQSPACKQTDELNVNTLQQATDLSSHVAGDKIVAYYVHAGTRKNKSFAVRIVFDSALVSHAIFTS